LKNPFKARDFQTLSRLFGSLLYTYYQELKKLIPLNRKRNAEEGFVFDFSFVEYNNKNMGSPGSIL